MDKVVPSGRNKKFQLAKKEELNVKVKHLFDCSCISNCLHVNTCLLYTCLSLIHVYLILGVLDHDISNGKSTPSFLSSSNYTSIELFFLFFYFFTKKGNNKM